jgi:polyhydroxybutyrate depolymerase
MHAHLRFAWVLIALAGACRPAGSETLRTGGRTRHFEAFVPSDTPGLPLVIALHGRGSTGRQMERFTHLDDIAAREQFVVVYPDAIDHHWNDSRAGQDTGVDDVAFIASLIDEMAARHHIDRSRVFVTGISNGAMMSYTLACELSDRIAAIAPVAGDLPAVPCHPARPISVLAINGTADPFVPYAGGIAGRGGRVLSAEASTDAFALRDGCSAPATAPEPDVDPTDGVRSRDRRYACPDRLAVELVTVDGGGHTWPGGPQYLPRLVIGPTSRDFDASERIWAFFAARE